MKLFNKLIKLNPLASIASNGILSDIDYYIDTGSYALNMLLSGSIYKGFPGNRIVGFAGPTSAGKTYLTISILKNYQKMADNNYVICYDTEGRLTKDKLQDAGIVIDRYLHAPIRNLEQFKTEIIQGLSIVKVEVGFGDQTNKKDVEEMDPAKLLEDEKQLEKKQEDAPRDNYFFVLDSLSQAGSDKEETDAIKGDVKADMGARARTIKSIFRNITMDLNILKYPMIVTSHVYNPMNQYQPNVIAGGTGLQYAAAIIIECLPTKDSVTDGKGNRHTIGTKIRCVLRKSELTKQWKSVPIKVNFANGLDRYSGLFEVCLENNIIVKDKTKYTFPDGNKYFMKDILETPEQVFTKASLDIIDVELGKIFTYGKNTEINTEEEDKNKIVEQINQEMKVKVGSPEDEIVNIPNVHELLGKSGEVSESEE